MHACLPVRLLCLSVCLSASPFAYTTTCLSCLSVFLYLPVYCVCLCACLSMCLSFILSTYKAIDLSAYIICMCSYFCIHLSASHTATMISLTEGGLNAIYFVACFNEINHHITSSTTIYTPQVIHIINTLCPQTHLSHTVNTLHFSGLIRSQHNM